MDGAHDFWGLIEPENAILPLPIRQVLLLSIHGWAVETDTPQYGLPALPCFVLIALCQIKADFCYEQAVHLFTQTRDAAPSSPCRG